MPSLAKSWWSKALTICSDGTSLRVMLPPDAFLMSSPRGRERGMEHMLRRHPVRELQGDRFVLCLRGCGTQGTKRGDEGERRHTRCGAGESGDWPVPPDLLRAVLMGSGSGPGRRRSVVLSRSAQGICPEAATRTPLAWITAQDAPAAGNGSSMTPASGTLAKRSQLASRKAR